MSETLRRVCCAGLMVLHIAFSASITRAQAPQLAAGDSLTGIVADRRGRPVEGATVILTGYSGGFADSGITSGAGAYKLAKPSGDSLLVLLVSSTPFSTARDVFARDVVTRNVVLKARGDMLAEVVILARQVPRARAHDLLAPDIGSLDRAAAGGANNLAPGSFGGNPLGAAAFMAGALIEYAADGAVRGVSILGLPSDQTNVTIDGAEASGLRIPRDARVAVRVSSSSYDVSRGGFSGAQVAVSTVPGNNFQQRFASFTQGTEIDWRNAQLSGTASGAASGPLVLDRAFYSTSLEVTTRRQSVVAFAADRDDQIIAGGLTRESAHRLEDAISSLGLRGSPDPSREANYFAALARLDFVRDSTISTVLQLRASMDRVGPTGGSPLAFPLVLGKSRSATGGLSITQTRYVGPTLNETNLSASASNQTRVPYLRLPFLRVRVQDADLGESGAREIAAGSIDDDDFGSRESSVDLSHAVRWVTVNRKLFFHAGAAARFARDSRDPQANDLGSYFFDSIADLMAARPAYFSRSIVAVGPSAHTTKASAFLGNVWVPSPGTSVQMGIRADLNQLDLANARENVAVVASDLGVEGSTSAAALDLSPRVGFTIDRAREKESRFVSYTIRGGVGRFVNDYGAGRVLGAAAPFVGARRGRRLDCAGADIPSLNWPEMASGTASAPGACVSGTAPSSLASGGQLLARSWKPPASWRGNLGVSTRMRQPWRFTADFVMSGTSRMPSIVESNLSLAPVFTLPNEASRPVFASADTVVERAIYGGLVPRRIHASFGPVDVLTSDLTSFARQAIVSAEYWAIGGKAVTLSYALTHATDESRGAHGMTSGDPRDVVRSRSSLAPTHVLTARASYPFSARVVASFFGRIQSGTRYTPRVSGDVNGDGRFNDHAFVFDPAATADDNVAAGMGDVMASAPRGARECLSRASGKIPERNSCTGPWTGILDAVAFVALGRNPARRSSLRIELLNIPSALDRMLHGSKIRGWGGHGMVDEVLLTATSFDAVSRTFTYRVNPAFGSVRGRGGLDNPFTIRLSISIPLAPAQAAQQLRIDTRRRERPSGEVLLDRYVDEYPNVALDVLVDADSVGLNAAQRDSLAILAREFDSDMRAVWRPVAESIHRNPGLVSAATARISAARTPAAIQYEAYAGMVRGVLEPGQLARLPFRAKFGLAPNALRVMGRSPR